MFEIPNLLPLNMNLRHTVKLYPISFSIDLQFEAAGNKALKAGGLFAGKDLFKAFSPLFDMF